ncbi:MAG: ABC transporter ATP-binding protein [Nocardioidaceae bacterium]
MTTTALWRLTRGPVRQEARPRAGSAALTVLGILVSLALPWPLALAVDHALGSQPAPGPLRGLSAHTLLVLAGLASVLLTAAAGLLEAAATTVGEQAAERIGGRLRARTMARALRLSLRWHAGVKRGELVSRISSDTSRVVDALIATTSTLVPELLALVAVLAVLLVVDPVMALVGLAVIPLLGVVAVRQRRAIRAAQQGSRAASGFLGSTSTDLVRHVPAIQAFGREDVALARFGADNDAVVAAEQAQIRTEARWLPRADIVLAGGTGLVLVLGGLTVLSGDQSIGHLLVVVAYLRELYAPVRGLTRLSTVLARAGVSADRLAEVVEATDSVPEHPGALDLTPSAFAGGGRGVALELRGVTFGYDPERPVLRDLDLEVPPGATVCLTGPNGVGKSTTLALLLRLYDVDAGAVRVAGIDVRDLTLDSLRSLVSFVPQDPWLTDGTVAENIAFGNPAATREEIEEAARTAGVTAFTDPAPLGLDSPVGDAGSALSGGQRRRVALARAIVRRAPVLLLDEPTASLDDAAVGEVREAIAQAGRGRTTLVVTHDDRLLPLADAVHELVPAASARPPVAAPSVRVPELAERR